MEIRIKNSYPMNALEFTDKINDACADFLSQVKPNFEFEVRFGSFEYDTTIRKSKFINDNSLQFFHSLKNALKKLSVEQTSNTIDEIYQDSYRTIKKSINTDNEKVYFQEKKTVRKFDIYDYNFRLALNKESLVSEIPNGFKHVCTRIKNRSSFLIGDLLRIDLTIIKESGCHEIELEVLGPIAIQDFKSVLYLILRIHQDNTIIISNNESRMIFKDYQNLVKERYFSGTQPETLHRSGLTKLYEQNYAVTDKIDGSRCFLYVHSSGRVYYINSNNIIHKTTLTCENKNSLIDAERFVQDQVTYFYMFDLLIHDSLDLRGLQQYNLYTRLELMQQYTFNGESSYYKVSRKKYYFKNVFTACKILLDEPSIYPKDGLIFVPIDECYPTTRKWKGLLKWKPAELNTIDFYSVNRLGTSIWDLYVYSTGNVNVLFDINELSPQSLCPERPLADTFYTEFDNKDGIFQSNTVIEYSYSLEQERWVPLKTRWDKTMQKRGNFTTIAMDIWKNIMYPVSLDVLVKFTKKSRIVYYKNLRFMHNRIKQALYNKYTKNTSSLLELCCGKGGDLNKWIFNKIKRVDCFDSDGNSLVELRKRVDQAQCNIIVNSRELDLTGTSAKKIIKEYAKECYNNVCCHFAIHYFFKSRELFESFISIVDDNLEIGGKFIITFMDKTRILELMGNQCKKICDDNGDVLYNLQITPNINSIFGNSIEIYLNGENYLSNSSKEYIIDFNFLIKYMESNGYKLVESELFQTQTQYINSLEDYEKDISFLNRFCVFEKTANTKVWPIPKIIRNVENVILVELFTIHNLIDFINTCTNTYIYKKEHPNAAVESLDSLEFLKEFKIQFIDLNDLDNNLIINTKPSTLLFYRDSCNNLFNVLPSRQKKIQINGNNVQDTRDTRDTKDTRDTRYNYVHDEALELLSEYTPDDQDERKYYEKMTVVEIKKILRERKLKLGGKKKELLDRLVESMNI